jgi:ribose transport system substrate-binding protein
MESTRPRTLEIRFMKGAWTEISGYRAIESFLKLSTSREASVVMIAAQNDAMALGARKAFLEKTRGLEQSQWLSLPFIGCDGLPNSGQAAVRSSQLAATVVIPPNAGKAVEALVSALKTGIQPPEHIFTEPTSFPMLASLRPTA